MLQRVAQNCVLPENFGLGIIENDCPIVSDKKENRIDKIIKANPLNDYRIDILQAVTFQDFLT